MERLNRMMAEADEWTEDRFGNRIGLWQECASRVRFSVQLANFWLFFQFSKVVKEALGDLYTEHVKITVKKSKSDSAFVFNNEHNRDMKTFKQTYFGATNKSQSFDDRLILDTDENKSDDNEDTILPEDEGRHQFLIFKN